MVLEISAAVLAEVDGLPRALDPPAPGGGIRRFVEAGQGTMNVSVAERTLSLRLDFPAHRTAHYCEEPALQPR